MAGNGSGRVGSSRSVGGNTAAAKRSQIFSAATQRRNAIRAASPASMAMKNQAMTKQAEAAYNRSQEGRRAQTVARMEFNRQTNANIGSGRGSRAVRRAKALGVGPFQRRKIRIAAR